MADLHLIEPARRDDLPHILSLLEACGLPPDGLEDHLSTALVLRAGGRVAGCAALELYGPHALLRSVAVRPELRGRGAGRRLTAAALSLARERGATSVYLLTQTAGGFFSRLGFRPVDRSRVPQSVRRSVEFVSACPESAQAMVLGAP
ncbi:GCN5-related N-acetyltransferase [Rubrobacter xylanophilus DSM 9941]|uniref:GCN5-related N-acetyltransferase n=1 Tax=Rubrobacter xylanophilus (strain DSM 9941 / JCM 11954 / NBRC 16129 / PRD-1) TaxID=266117 RepID=Q1AS40_RUBXD|nr:arsenic resistance N-acetyltransferase ArsN2 [Rubrobacter xylanophilus]ABG05788.1 GCN5-related N-acetyltransferase [Rubrobacter xylanophilus DSM 9941]